MTLKFSAGNHQYRLDGKYVPGVTTLIKNGLPKPALMYWSARSVAEFVADNREDVEALWRMGREPMVGALKGVPWEFRDRAAVKGTDVHALAEEIIHGREVEVPDHLVDHVEGYVRFIDRFKVEAIATEMPVGNRSCWYAGTFDAVITFGAGPWKSRTVLVDNKTSSGVYGETGLQTAAYARGEFMGLESGTEASMPEIESTGVLHVTAGGTRFFPLLNTPAEIDDAFLVFRHVAWVAGRADWIKNLVGNPFEEPEEES
jgi:hypothetical protein